MFSPKKSQRNQKRCTGTCISVLLSNRVVPTTLVVPVPVLPILVCRHTGSGSPVVDIMQLAHDTLGHMAQGQVGKTTGKRNTGKSRIENVDETNRCQMAEQDRQP